MRTIHKYQFPGPGIRVPDASFEIPTRGQILYVAIQKGRVTIWVEVETNNAVEVRQFMLIGTGYIISIDLLYRGTVMDDPFVWHLYEVMK